MLKKTILLLAIIMLLSAQKDRSDERRNNRRVGGFEKVDLSNRENSEDLLLISEIIEKSKEIYANSP